MTYFLLRDYNILPKKELLLSPWVGTLDPEGVACQRDMDLRTLIPPGLKRHPGTLEGPCVRNRHCGLAYVLNILLLGRYFVRTLAGSLNVGGRSDVPRVVRCIESTQQVDVWDVFL